MLIHISVRACGRGLFALSACLFAGAASAQDASPWASDQHSAVRLLAGSRSGAVLLAGISFKLEPGWKTYWRTPGDSGVPPRFDFSASDNVEAVTVLWPAPMSFPDGAGGVSFGYKKQVVLPLRIVPKDSDKPVTLRGAISYAVCEKTCIPIEAKLELRLATAASTEDRTLSAALDELPKPAKIGDDNPLTVTGVHRDGKQQMIVDVTAPAGSLPELFAEGPTPDWSLPSPNLITRNGNELKFRFELDGLPSNTSPDGAALKLTLVGKGANAAAYEFNTTIGPAPK